MANGNRTATSTYSFYRFGAESNPTVDECIDRAGEMGFDGVEILELQLDRRDRGPVRLPRLGVAGIRRQGRLGCGLAEIPDHAPRGLQRRDRSVNSMIGTARISLTMWLTLCASIALGAPGGELLNGGVEIGDHLGCATGLHGRAHGYHAGEQEYRGPRYA